MSVPKEKSILRLLERLDLEKRGWIVLDNWDADLCAVGIAVANRPRQLVYVSTFNRGPGVYHFECETPTGDSDAEYVITHRNEKASFAELLHALESHLGSPSDEGQALSGS